MKLIKKFDDVISVFFDKEWEVYKVVVDGRPEATAEEDEKQDAFDTAAAMVEVRNQTNKETMHRKTRNEKICGKT